jgi:hypothetical protein
MLNFKLLGMSAVNRPSEVENPCWQIQEASDDSYRYLVPDDPFFSYQTTSSLVRLQSGSVPHLQVRIKNLLSLFKS